MHVFHDASEALPNHVLRLDMLHEASVPRRLLACAYAAVVVWLDLTVKLELIGWPEASIVWHLLVG